MVSLSDSQALLKI